MMIYVLSIAVKTSGPWSGRQNPARLQESSNIVVLDPEIAKAFPNTKAVNDALAAFSN